MLVKIEMPEGAKILKNEKNEIIVDLPRFCGQYQTAVSVFSVKGHTLNDFVNNEAISSAEVLIASDGRLEAEADEINDYCDEAET